MIDYMLIFAQFDVSLRIEYLFTKDFHMVILIFILRSNKYHVLNMNLTRLCRKVLYAGQEY